MEKSKATLYFSPLKSLLGDCREVSILGASSCNSPQSPARSAALFSTWPLEQKICSSCIYLTMISFIICALSSLLFFFLNIWVTGCMQDRFLLMSCAHPPIPKVLSYISTKRETVRGGDYSEMKPSAIWQPLGSS